MRIAVIGAGRIGGNIAERWSRAGHEVVLSFSRSADRLAAQAASIGARAGHPRDAVAASEVVLLSVPWSALDSALEQAGSLSGRLVIDTTNPFGPDGLVAFPDGTTAATANAARFTGARYAKAFNTLTSAFQRGVDAGDPPAMFYAVADDDAAAPTSDLVATCGFVPTRLPWSAVAMLEAPRRTGAVYGEEYGPEEAARIAAAAATDPQRAARLATELRRPE